MDWHCDHVENDVARDRKIVAVVMTHQRWLQLLQSLYDLLSETQTP
jgi:hypothetical protein